MLTADAHTPRDAPPTVRWVARLAFRLIVGAVLLVGLPLCVTWAWLYEAATDGRFVRRLPTTMGMTEGEVIAVLGPPSERMASSAPPMPMNGRAYAYATYAGACGDLPPWHRRSEPGVALSPPARLPTPVGTLLWFRGRTVLIAGYYFDAIGHLGCVVVGVT